MVRGPSAWWKVPVLHGILICLGQGVGCTCGFLSARCQVGSQPVQKQPLVQPTLLVFRFTSPFWTCLVYTSCPEAISGANLSAPFLFSFLFINFWLIIAPAFGEGKRGERKGEEEEMKRYNFIIP